MQDAVDALASKAAQAAAFGSSTERHAMGAHSGAVLPEGATWHTVTVHYPR